MRNVAIFSLTNLILKNKHHHGQNIEITNLRYFQLQFRAIITKPIPIAEILNYY